MEKWKIANESILKIQANPEQLTHMFIPQSTSTSFLPQNVCEASVMEKVENIQWKYSQNSRKFCVAGKMFIPMSSSSSFLLQNVCEVNVMGKSGK
jgi:hypothetical protein